MLFYFYTPRVGEREVTTLVTVKLPEITAECTASAADQGKDGKYACDYPTDKLLKAISAKLETKNPAAFSFLEEDEVERQRSEHRHAVQERRRHDDRSRGAEVGRRQRVRLEGVVS